jgi:hypothetical protein
LVASKFSQNLVASDGLSGGARAGIPSLSARKELSRVIDNISAGAAGVNNDADLSALMAEVAHILLGKPNGGATRSDWRYGNNGSLSIDPRRGVWKDFESGRGGGVLALITRQTGRADGLAWLREQGLLGAADGPRKNSAAGQTGHGHANGARNGHNDKDAHTERKLNEARRITAETKPIRGTPAGAYLKSRGIDINASKLSDEDLRDVRFHPGDPSRGYTPMLVGLLRDLATGSLVDSIHRTPINADGTRAPDPRNKDGRPLKKMGLGRYGYGMVCIGDMSKHGPICIGEGIEDVLSVVSHTGTKGMATLGSGRMIKMRLPPGTQVVLIAQQKNDVDKANWEKAGQNFLAQGCEVDVIWPGKYGDINDLLIAEGPAAIKNAIESSEPVTAVKVDIDDDDDEEGDGKGSVGGYRFSDGGIEYYARAPNAKVGNWVRITNFKAKITSDIRMDDGVECIHTFEIEATINGRTSTFLVPAAQFGNMNWVPENLGAEAVVFPNQEKRTRVGIQLLSGAITRRSVFTHTGFRLINDEHVYMHGGGALGADGPIDAIEVQLPTGIANYVLETHGAQIGDELLRAAVEASMQVISVAPYKVTIPLHASVARAILGGADYAPHLVGKTGARKTELAALEQQHFGPAMHSRAIPGSWSSTDNFLESSASATKDAIYVIDDYVTTGSSADASRLGAKADRVLRAQGNASGRGRLRSDATQRQTRPPRGQIISTGEDIPPGQSLRARLLVIPVALDDVDLEKLSIAQRHASNGDYARATAGFICWLAPQLDERRKEFKELTHQYRTEFPDGVHGRTTDIFAQVMAAWKIFLRFVVATGAWTQEEADSLLETIRETLNELIVEQSDHQRIFDAVVRFQTNLESALSSGKAHIGRAAHPDKPPPGALSVGWKRIEVMTGEGTEHRWQSSGPCIGWYAEDGVYLNGEAAYTAAQQVAAATGSGICVQPDTLFRRMREDNLLLSLETRGGKTYLKPRKTIAGMRRPVIHVAHEFIGLRKPPSSTNGSPSSPNDPGEYFSEEVQDARE